MTAFQSSTDFAVETMRSAERDEYVRTKERAHMLFTQIRELGVNQATDVHDLITRAFMAEQRIGERKADAVIDRLERRVRGL